MNLLLIDSEEVRAEEVLLSGRRAEHLVQVLRVKPGSVVRVGLINGPVGRGRVLDCTEGRVRLALDWVQPMGERAASAGSAQPYSSQYSNPELELILALPRPIMLQRILRQATVLGVRRFHLIRSNRVEKSFFHSPILQPDKIRSLLLEGLEQAMDTRLPELYLYTRFKPFEEDVLPLIPGQGLIAHPGVAGMLQAAPFFTEPTVPSALGAQAPSLLLAIGPEGGWSDYEVQRFVELGFHAFAMGSRILHVDTAVVTLLAQIQLLCQLRGS